MTRRQRRRRRRRDLNRRPLRRRDHPGSRHPDRPLWAWTTPAVNFVLSLSDLNKSYGQEGSLLVSLSNRGSGCSTAVERRPAEQNSWGRGFDSYQVLGFFLFSFYPSVVRPLSGSWRRCKTTDVHSQKDAQLRPKTSLSTQSCCYCWLQTLLIYAHFPPTAKVIFLSIWMGWHQTVLDHQLCFFLPTTLYWRREGAFRKNWDWKLVPLLHYRPHYQLEHGYSSYLMKF